MGRIIYVAIDVGCHECGVGSEVISAHWQREAAIAAAKERSEATKEWREGGQSIPDVFEVELPE